MRIPAALGKLVAELWDAKPPRRRRSAGSVAVQALESRLLLSANSIAGVDLKPTTVDAPPTAARGTEITVETRVENSGVADSPAYTIRYYLSTDSQISTQDMLLKTVIRPELEGASFQEWSETVTLPSNLKPGNYRIGVIVDPLGKISESNEGNNSRADSTAIAVTLPVDLTANLVDAPSMAFRGSLVPVLTSVSNLGTSDSGSWTIRYYLSSDANVTTSDVLLKTVTRTGLGAGESQEWSEQVRLPANTTGDWYIGVIIDPANSISETNESNNVGVASTPVSITIPPPIDLDPSAVVAPTTAISGTTIEVDTSIQNRGASASGEYTIRYYLSTDSKITASDMLLKTVTRTGIDGLSTQQWFEQVELPDNVSGTRYLGVIVDPLNAIVETNEGNNAQASANKIKLMLPPTVDLVPTDVTGPSAGFAGRTVSVETTVANIGSTASGKYTIRYYLSADANITTSDQLLKTVTRASIAASGTQQWTESILLPKGLTGSYYIGVIVDPNNSLREIDEANNAKANTAAHLISPAPVIDLTASIADAPSAGYAGQAVAVNTTVLNLGSSASGQYTISYYLSKDKKITRSDTLLKTVTRESIDGQSFQQWFEDVVLPAGFQGSRYIGVLVDPLNAIIETNESNNARRDSGKIAITIAPTIDLTPVVVEGPASAYAGTTVSVTTTVSNIGSTASGKYTVRYYLSTDATITTGDTLLKTVTRPALAASDIQEWTESIALPASITGIRYIGVIVDPTNAIREISESNNALAASAPVSITTAPRIDLDPRLVDGPLSGTLGSTISVLTDIDNLGTSPSGAYTVNYYLSTDLKITTSDILLKTVSRDSIAGLSRQQWTESLLLESTLATGKFYLGILVDPWNEILETNETNNAQADSAAIIISESTEGFRIQLTYSGMTASQIAIFNQAAAHWESIITSDLPDAVYNGVFVDDILISASAVRIDGVGGILGQAAPTRFRADSFLPYYGFMQFDSADLARLEANGMLQAVIEHEMGHVLGIGTIWSMKGLLTGAGTSNPIFIGEQATAAYNAIFGTDAAGVPVEGNNSPSGSRDSHWRESAFGTELMTPYISGAVNPLSSVTIASLADLGYTVDMSMADDFAPPNSVALSPAAGAGGSTMGQGLSTGCLCTQCQAAAGGPERRTAPQAEKIVPIAFGTTSSAGDLRIFPGPADPGFAQQARPAGGNGVDGDFSADLSQNSGDRQTPRTQCRVGTSDVSGVNAPKRIPTTDAGACWIENTFAGLMNGDLNLAG